MITPDTIQQPRQDAERNPSTGCFDHLVDKVAERTELAKPERYSDDPGQEAGVLAQSLVLRDDHRGRAERFDARSRVTREHERHAHGRKCEEARPRGRLRGHQGRQGLCCQQHPRSVAGIEARVHRVCE